MVLENFALSHLVAFVYIIKKAWQMRVKKHMEKSP